MNHPVIPETIHVESNEKLGQCSQTEAWLKYKQDSYDFVVETRTPIWEIKIKEKKRRFNWQKLFKFIGCYFGYITIGNILDKYNLHFIFLTMFSFASLGLTYWLMGINIEDKWRNHFYKEDKNVR